MEKNKKKVVQVGNFILEMKAVDDGHVAIDMHVVVDKSVDRGKVVAESPVAGRGGRSTLNNMQTPTTDYSMLSARNSTAKAYDPQSSSNETSYSYGAHDWDRGIVGESRYLDAALKEAGELCSEAYTNSFGRYKVAERSNVSAEKPNKSNHKKKIQEATKKSQEAPNAAEVAEVAGGSEDLGSSYSASGIPRFSYAEVKGATYDDFNRYAKIGDGRHWTVYEGMIGKTKVAIKKLAVETKNGESEFRGELEFVLSKLSHPNIVKLLGACFESQALVYEFLPNGSLEDYFTEKRSPELLTWQIRTRIIYDICSALVFLHGRRPNPVVHGNLKPSSVLLDAGYRCRLSNFGLSRFLPPPQSDAAFHKTLPKGTFGYIDPEFVATGRLKPSSDVYSFGVTVLRVLTGLPAVGIKGRVVEACGDGEPERTLMRMVDATAGRWPADVARKLARYGVRFCDGFEKSSKLLNEFSAELEAILAKIDSI